MLKIDGNKTIHMTRGDYGQITVNFNENMQGNLVYLSVFEANDLSKVIFSFGKQCEDGTSVTLDIYPDDTRGIPATNTPLTYWYEIEVNPGGEHAITVIGYDTLGPKLFIVYPEGQLEDTSGEDN